MDKTMAAVAGGLIVLIAVASVFLAGLIYHETSTPGSPAFPGESGQGETGGSSGNYTSGNATCTCTCVCNESLAVSLNVLVDWPMKNIDDRYPDTDLLAMMQLSFYNHRDGPVIVENISIVDVVVYGERAKATMLNTSLLPLTIEPGSGATVMLYAVLSLNTTPPSKTMLDFPTAINYLELRIDTNASTIRYVYHREKPVLPPPPGASPSEYLVIEEVLILVHHDIDDYANKTLTLAITLKNQGYETVKVTKIAVDNLTMFYDPANPITLRPGQTYTDSFTVRVYDTVGRWEAGTSHLVKVYYRVPGTSIEYMVTTTTTIQ